MRLKRPKQKLTDPIDVVMLIGGILGPLFTLPQVLKVYMENNTSGVSALSWILYSLLSFIGVIYSIKHKDRILLVGYALYFIMDILVAIGAVVK